MHILVVNDDGPPSNQSSPYVHSLVSTLQAAGHRISVVLPHVQRSWIGKAHMIGQTLSVSYFQPGTLHKDDGITSDQPFNNGKEEWILVDGTPASCTQIGLFHVFKDRGPIDLVVSGPNYGRNTTALFALSSGTIGAAMEGAINGKKSISLSYAFDSREHDPEIIAAASKRSTKLIEKLVNEWPDDVHLYSINVPLRKGVDSTKILYCEMLQNQWTSGGSFAQLPDEEEDVDPNVDEQAIREGRETNGEIGQKVTRQKNLKFKWSPNFADVRKSAQEAQSGDGWEVMQGHITVTPLRANFWHLPHYKGEIKLDQVIPSRIENHDTNPMHSIYAFVQYPDPYVQPLIIHSLQQNSVLNIQTIDSPNLLPNSASKVLQFADYEFLNFEHALKYPQTSLVCAYIIRKALIRKHYLSNTISSWITKHPESILKSHFKECVHFELDYAEFLDDALVDAWDLNESMTRNDQQSDDSRKEWWILKPGMSDGGNGIRLFSSLLELQTIFEEWEHDDEDKDETEHEEMDGITSQLRHFVAQPYIDNPLLLKDHANRKFHLRVYVLAAGALKVYVYKEILALFAANPYTHPSAQEMIDIDLTRHLTNTCLQPETQTSSAVHRLSTLPLTVSQHDSIVTQIGNLTSAIFEAAAREQAIHFQTRPNAFEIFGVDSLVDVDFKVWLLEVNAYPDFKQTGNELQEIVVGGLFDGVVDVAILPFFGGGDEQQEEVRKESKEEKMKMVLDIDLGRR